MKYKSRGLIAIFCVAVFLCSGCTERSAESPLQEEDGLYIQTANERTWLDHELEEEPFIPTEHEAMFNPARLVLQGDTVYVLDLGDMRIKQFDADGTKVQAIGEGRGQGPGEVIQVSDLHVSDNAIWMPDSQTGQLSQFSLDGDFVERYALDGHLVRIAGTGRRVLVQAIGTPMPFHLVRPDGTKERQFGERFSEIDPTGMATHGHLAMHKNTFIFAPQYAGRLFFITEEGSIERVVATLDGHDFPEAERTDQGAHAPDAPVQTSGISVHDGLVYLQTYQEDADAWYIDRYDADTGAYLDTIRFPWEIKDLQVNGDGMYALSGTGVFRFEAP